jgi:Flp pilus assembly protein TadG
MKTIAVRHAHGNRPGMARGIEERERGSITIFVVFFAIIALALAALLVDVGNAMNAKERASDIAEQAARAGADDIDTDTLRTSGTVTINYAQALPDCQSLALQYGEQTTGNDKFDVQATCSPGPGANEVTATVSVTTTPIIAVSLGQFTETVSRSAHPECGITAGGQC